MELVWLSINVELSYKSTSSNLRLFSHAVVDNTFKVRPFQLAGKTQQSIRSWRACKAIYSFLYTLADAIESTKVGKHFFFEILFRISFVLRF